MLQLHVNNKHAYQLVYGSSAGCPDRSWRYNTEATVQQNCNLHSVFVREGRTLPPNEIPSDAWWARWLLWLHHNNPDRLSRNGGFSGLFLVMRCWLLHTTMVQRVSFFINPHLKGLLEPCESFNRHRRLLRYAWCYTEKHAPGLLQACGSAGTVYTKDIWPRDWNSVMLKV